MDTVTPGRLTRDEPPQGTGIPNMHFKCLLRRRPALRSAKCWKFKGFQLNSICVILKQEKASQVTKKYSVSPVDTLHGGAAACFGSNFSPNLAALA